MTRITAYYLNDLIYDKTSIDEINNTAKQLYPKYQEYTKYDIIYFHLNKRLIDNIHYIIKSRVELDIIGVAK